MCSNCQYLDIKNKKEGIVDGAIYYCKLKKEYISASSNRCEKYEKDDKRDKETIDKILDESKNYDDIPLSVESIFTIVIILIIIGIFTGIFK